MNPKKFVSELASIELPDVFNPYAHNCVIHDSSDGASIRRQNLVSYLEVLLRQGAQTMWMGRDLGYRGGRRTGLALTDEKHLSSFSRVYPGSSAKKATSTDLVAERTAAEIWGQIQLLDEPPLLWNVFPFHPHESQSEMTNRKFRSRELALVKELNAELINMMGVEQILGIGNDAAAYSKAFGVQTDYVRHPSYGGVKDFREGIAKYHSMTQPHCENLQFAFG